MVTHSDEGSFWSVVKKGAEQAAQDEGVKLIWSPSNNDPQKEAQLIDAAVSQKVDGLAVSVPNADAIQGSLQKAKAAGHPDHHAQLRRRPTPRRWARSRTSARTRRSPAAPPARASRPRAPRRCCASSTSRATSASSSAATASSRASAATVTNLQVKGTADLATTQTEIKSKLQADKSYDQVIALNPDIAEAAKTAIKGASSSAKLATFDLSPDVIKDIQAGEHRVRHRPAVGLFSDFILSSDLEQLALFFGLVLVAVGAHLGVFLVDGIELCVAQLLNIHHLVLRFVDRVYQLVEFQVDSACVTILRVLDDEDHEERDDGRAGVDDQLPGIGVVKIGPVNAQTTMMTIAPTNAHFEPSQLEAAAANLPKASP